MSDGVREMWDLGRWLGKLLFGSSKRSSRNEYENYNRENQNEEQFNEELENTPTSTEYMEEEEESEEIGYTPENKKNSTKKEQNKF